MPFQSEKQRRYLWANEPEIARDWTDTYGSRISKLHGGIMHHDARRGFPGGSGRAGDSAMPTGGSGANYGGPPGGGATSQGSGRDVYTAPINRHIGPTNQEALRIGALKKSVRDFEQEKDYNSMGQIKPGPRIGPQRGGLKNWAANYAGANVGAGLGSMLLGGLPGLILGTLFGNRTSRNLMNPQYKGSTLKDRLRNIFAFSNDYIPNQRPEGTGIETIDPSLLINAESDPRYLWRMIQKAKEEERLRALASQRITQQDLMGMV